MSEGPRLQVGRDVSIHAAALRPQPKTLTVTYPFGKIAWPISARDNHLAWLTRIVLGIRNPYCQQLIYFGNDFSVLVLADIEAHPTRSTPSETCMSPKPRDFRAASCTQRDNVSCPSQSRLA